MGENGVNHFVAPVTKRVPKLYVFSHEGGLIYIGQTVQGMSARIRLGFKANGAGGYWGYHWRRTLPRATLHIWCVENIIEDDGLQALECIEADASNRPPTSRFYFGVVSIRSSRNRNRSPLRFSTIRNSSRLHACRSSGRSRSSCVCPSSSRQRSCKLRPRIMASSYSLCSPQSMGV